jgi:dipeptidyl aminopeptidase/acylaminoacyl peptidase
MPWMRRLQSWLMSRRTSHPALFAARSPVNYAERYSAPVLIIHGGSDPAVPASQAEEMTTRLRELGKDVECWV